MTFPFDSQRTHGRWLTLANLFDPALAGLPKLLRGELSVAFLQSKPEAPT